MAYTKKTWKPRISQYPGRRRMVGTGEANTYDITRAEGTITQTGDAFSADNMNDLETRISNEFTSLNNNLSTLSCDTLRLRTKLYQANINSGGQTTIALEYNAGDLCAFLISVTGASNAAAVSGHLLGSTSSKPTSVYLANAISGGVNQWCYAMVGYLYK